MSLAGVSCGGLIAGDARGSDPAAGAATVVTTTDALRGHRRAPPPADTGNSGAGGATGASSSTTAAAAPTTVDEAIAAAQTPDGRAIPQGANADGTCPAVLTFLGFWSCPTMGETCAYSSADGVNHACLCQRTDGEGQTPSWVCQ